MLLATPVKAPRSNPGTCGRQDKQPPRQAFCLPFSVPLAQAGPCARRDAPVLLSYTRLVGTEEMELLVPSLPFVYRYLLGGDFTLRFTLELPAGPVEVLASPVYDKPLRDDETDIGYIVTGDQVEIKATPRQYERYDRAETEMACLLGVRVKEMSLRDRMLLRKHLEEEAAAEQALHVGQVTILPDEDDNVLAFPTPTPRATAETVGSFKIYGT